MNSVYAINTSRESRLIDGFTNIRDQPTLQIRKETGKTSDSRILGMGIALKLVNDHLTISGIANTRYLTLY